MDWIERLFHISPDGGNGSLELGIFVGAAVAVAMAVAGALKVSPRARAWSARLLRRRGRPSSTSERFGG
jgi:hypothetical protein